MPGLFGGGGGGDAAIEAANIQAQSANRAAQLQYQMYQDAVAREQPWVMAGTGAVSQLGGLYGLPGYTAQDPTATLKATPGYNWLLGQGVNARDLSAASRGLNLSGAQQKGLTNFGQNLAQTYAWAPYVSGLTGLSGAGQSGAALMVVVEASLADVSQGRYQSAMKPQAALQSIITFQVRYRIPFIWAGSRKAAEYCTFWTLAKYLRELEERFRTATKAQEKAA